MIASLLPCLLALAGPPEVALPPLAKAPVIDGTIGEDEWAGAVRNVGLVGGSGKLEARDAVFWAAADGQNLYVAMRSETPPGGSLTRAVPDPEHNSLDVLHDDSIELVIHPHLDVTTGDRRYFHLIANARGALFVRAIDPGNPANPVDATWRPAAWTFKSHEAEGVWEVEVAFPFTSLGASAADLAHPWGLRICRNFLRPWDQSRWETSHAAYEDVPTMPRVTFTAGAPVVQVLGLRGADAPRIELAVANPGAAPLPVRVYLSDVWSRNAPKELDQTLTLAPGARQTVRLDPPDGGPAGSHHTILRVASPDGGRAYYAREFDWDLARPADRWTVADEDRQAVGVQWAVYPYASKLHARVDLQALASRDEVTGGTLSFGAPGKAPLASCALAFREHLADAWLKLPDLPAGQYQVAVKLDGPASVPKEPVVQPYERKVFPWEHNQLGKSDLLVPPYTPITLQGNRLGTILREHQLAGTGLWDQVTTEGRPLLKGPMRWRATVGGQEVAIQPARLAVAERRPTRAVTTGGFTAGPVRAEVRSTWDYDGLARVVVSLPATPGATLDALSLDIPLDDALAGYLHTCGDGLRFNYAGKTPAGEGIVWDSTKANRQAIRNAFYPYVQVGDGEHGLVWCADTDRGMSFDAKTPMLTLTRRDGVLTLTVNLVTKPVRLDQPRAMEFGLQATPAKPMPADWRRWVQHAYPDQQAQPFAIMGSNPYYGEVSYDLYPIGHDLSIYEAFSKARDTGKRDEAFVKRWLTKYTFAKPGSEREEFFTRHINAGMQVSSTTPRSQGWLLTPYTNPRGMGAQMAEWPVFQDEWISLPFMQRSTSGSVDYDITPSASLRDAELWSYREMMTCFDGIYWDNVFLAANTNPTADGVWTDEAGQVHPSMGLWDQREMVRRTAVLFCEQGRPRFSNVVHMTNACLVPIFSFATVNLDWEWQYGNRDFQDRFTPEFTVAETIARPCGNVPLVLAGGNTAPDKAAMDRLLRTRTGVLMVHEVRVWDWQPASMWDLYAKLFAFGYGTDACTVYNYWQPGFPLTITGVDGRGIVLRNGPKAIVIVSDYGNGGTCTLKLDAAKLGLPATLKAKDLETGEALAGEGGEVTFALAKHDYRAVSFE